MDEECQVFGIFYIWVDMSRGNFCVKLLLLVVLEFVFNRFNAVTDLFYLSLWGRVDVELCRFKE